MSIEYTIDIQLTELGFPVTQQTSEANARDRRSSPSEHQHLIAGKKAAKQTSIIGQDGAAVPASPCGSPGRSPGLRGKQAAGGSAHPQNLSVPRGSEPAAGAEAPAGPPTTTERGGDGDEAQEKPAGVQENVESDSDGSDVSDVYEEEEEEEEADEEEEFEAEEVQNIELSRSGSFRCSVCGLQLLSEFKLQDHMNLHTGSRPYCCAECGKRFCQIYNYRVHLRTHAQTKVDRLRCRICMMGFASQEDLKDHLSKTHFENEFYECDLCKRVFTSLKACEYHVQLHKCMTNVICEVCGRNFTSPKSLVRHRRKMCHRSFRCTDCAKTFLKKNALLKHSFSHLGLLPYTCVRCRCHFRLAKLYHKHKCEPERIHCVACLREFLSQEDFQQHKKDTGCWGNQEPKGDEIRCLECGERFATTEELKRHAGAHQRVLKCAECGKGFRSALLLMSHMGGHAGNSPCLCQSCGLGFPHQQNYDSHLKTCGQTLQPASTPRKPQASRSSSADTKKLDTKPQTPNPANPVTEPAAVSNPPTAPAQNAASPGPVTGGLSTTGSDSSEGLWKLTLDKQPPPGVNLVLFLPVCPSQSSSLTLPPAVLQTPLFPDVQHQKASQAFSSNEHFGVPLNMGLVAGMKHDPECEEPLDLSRKCNTSKSPPSDVSLLPVKNEPEEFEVSREAERRDVNSNGADANPEVKRFKTGTMVFPPSDDNKTSPVVTGIKEEPRSPGSDSSSPMTDWRPEKDIKMEVDPQPCCAALET